MRLMKCFLLASALLSGAAIAQHAATVHQQLTQLAEDIVYTSARLFPTQATFLGITQYDAELEIPSEKNRAAYIAQLQQWKTRLHAIAPAAAPDLSLVDRDDAKLLEAQLSQSLNALQVYQVDRKDYSIGANTIVFCVFSSAAVFAGRRPRWCDARDSRESVGGYHEPPEQGARVHRRVPATRHAPRSSLRHRRQRGTRRCAESLQWRPDRGREGSLRRRQRIFEPFPARAGCRAWRR